MLLLTRQLSLISVDQLVLSPVRSYLDTHRKASGANHHGMPLCDRKRHSRWLTRQVKRSASSSPCPSPDLKPATPTKKPKNTPKSSPTKSENGSRPIPGQWTGAKKAALVEHLLAAGLAATKAEDLAKSVGTPAAIVSSPLPLAHFQLDLKKEQITDMTKKEKNNLRSKVVAYAQTL